MQLPPLVSSDLADMGGFGESMLKRLAEKHPDSVCQLTFQYRMHEDICQLSNDIVYAGSLKCGNDDVRYRKLDLPGFPENMGNIGDVATNAWLMRSVDPDFPVVFLDTDKIRLDLSSKGEGLEALERTLRNRDGGSIVNYVEARIVQLIVEGFLSCGIEAQAVGVICPFRAQLRVMDECASLASWKSKGLEMSTIDRYQGRDKPVVVVSFVRSNEKGRVGRLLQDFRRLNVAITRAKCKLVMVGSFTTLYAGSNVLKPVLNRMRNKDNVVSLSPNVFTTNIDSQ
ncbi:predicted protein [Phaeodactylum tricornutum CCAP 1055/1]|uniref:DNA2/NAM7 helicase-like C-terminal domain-containing protein n=3 Tax=Phaeodactylum tricornutum TaxID=2850 RepID=B7FYH2_PHATC|nr:predicted protein [Phaeodactylum tricornutum CCAP 1055/1]EEC48725.1 predicted protein [Phaeodactylum tricornutum CCAP 1055/1]|eukprot:XP_002179739.1 predicted protein [Phaeodactylum tricornutum CCAP 1055/1]